MVSDAQLLCLNLAAQQPDEGHSTRHWFQPLFGACMQISGLQGDATQCMLVVQPVGSPLCLMDLFGFDNSNVKMFMLPRKIA